jgi:hypothetical protein
MASKVAAAAEGKQQAVAARGLTVRDRVGRAEEALARAEATLSEQDEKIARLTQLNSELVSELTGFKSAMANAVQAAITQLNGDLKGKHAVIRAKNRKLEGVVAEQVAEKAALTSQIEALSFRLSRLEEEVGTVP